MKALIKVENTSDDDDGDVLDVFRSSIKHDKDAIGIPMTSIPSHVFNGYSSTGTEEMDTSGSKSEVTGIDAKTTESEASGKLCSGSVKFVESNKKTEKDESKSDSKVLKESNNETDLNMVDKKSSVSDLDDENNLEKPTRNEDEKSSAKNDTNPEECTVQNENNSSKNENTIIDTDKDNRNSEEIIETEENSQTEDNSKATQDDGKKEEKEKKISTEDSKKSSPGKENEKAEEQEKVTILGNKNNPEQKKKKAEQEQEKAPFLGNKNNPEQENEKAVQEQEKAPILDSNKNNPEQENEKAEQKQEEQEKAPNSGSNKNNPEQENKKAEQKQEEQEKVPNLGCNKNNPEQENEKETIGTPDTKKYHSENEEINKESEIICLENVATPEKENDKAKKNTTNTSEKYPPENEESEMNSLEKENDKAEKNTTSTSENKETEMNGLESDENGSRKDDCIEKGNGHSENEEMKENESGNGHSGKESSPREREYANVDEEDGNGKQNSKPMGEKEKELLEDWLSDEEVPDYTGTTRNTINNTRPTNITTGITITAPTITDTTTGATTHIKAPTIGSTIPHQVPTTTMDVTEVPIFTPEIPIVTLDDSDDEKMEDNDVERRGGMARRGGTARRGREFAIRGRGAGFAVRGTGFARRGAGFANRGAGFAARGAEFAARGAGFAARGAEFAARGAEFTARGAGLVVRGRGRPRGRPRGSGSGTARRGRGRSILRGSIFNIPGLVNLGTIKRKRDRIMNNDLDYDQENGIAQKRKMDDNELNPENETERNKEKRNENETERNKEKRNENETERRLKDQTDDQNCDQINTRKFDNDRGDELLFVDVENIEEDNNMNLQLSPGSFIKTPPQKENILKRKRDDSTEDMENATQKKKNNEERVNEKTGRDNTSLEINGENVMSDGESDVTVDGAQGVDDGDDDDDDDSDNDNEYKGFKTKIIEERLRHRPEPPPGKYMTPIKNTDFGRIVWGAMTGYSPWPAIIVGHEDCGMDEPPPNKAWLFWLADYRVLEVSLNNIQDFLEVQIPARMERTARKERNIQRAVEEGLQELRRQSSLRPMMPYDLMGWAQSGCPGAKHYDPHEPCHISARIYRAMMKMKLMMAGYEKCIYQALDKEPEKSWIPKVALLEEVRRGEENIENVCIGCHEVERNITNRHPDFLGGLCDICRETVDDTQVKEKTEFCGICGSPGEMMLCDSMDCERVYCIGCIMLLVGPDAVELIKDTDPWECFVCTPHQQDTHGLIIPRAVQQIFMIDDVKVRWSAVNPPSAPNPELFPKRPIRVLSLFDGISTGLVVLNKLGLDVEVYYASEIRESALYVSQTNHGDNIQYLGDVKTLTNSKIAEMCPIDLLIGGSPCNDLSFVNANRKGLYDFAGSGPLFFHYYRIMKEIKLHNKETHLFWLFENVRNMPKAYLKDISIFLDSEPVVINSMNFSPQQRKRCFWGNLPNIYQHVPSTLGSNIHLSQCLDRVRGRSANVEKVNCITGNPNSLMLKNGSSHPISMNGRGDVPTSTELEKIFGFPPHYTDTMNIPAKERQGLLGRSWSVSVIEYLLKPLLRYFSHVKKPQPECSQNSTIGNNHKRPSFNGQGSSLDNHKRASSSGASFNGQGSSLDDHKRASFSGASFNGQGSSLDNHIRASSSGASFNGNWSSLDNHIRASSSGASFNGNWSSLDNHIRASSSSASFNGNWSSLDKQKIARFNGQGSSLDNHKRASFNGIQESSSNNDDSPSLSENEDITIEFAQINNGQKLENSDTPTQSKINQKIIIKKPSPASNSQKSPGKSKSKEKTRQSPRKSEQKLTKAQELVNRYRASKEIVLKNVKKTGTLTPIRTVGVDLNSIKDVRVQLNKLTPTHLKKYEDMIMQNKT